MKVLLVNLMSSDSFSFDFSLGGGRALRGKIPAGGSFDVGADATADELNRNPQIRALVSAGRLAVSSQSDSSDIEGLLDTQLLQATQQVAATLADTFMGTADQTGVVQVEASCGAIPGAGESMTIDVKKNGVTILTTPVVLNATTATPARKTSFATEVTGASVLKGDELSYSLTYVAGTATPIVRTSVRVKILKAV